jgi:hypothetical protein
MGRCTVVKSATIVKRSWNQEKYTLPWPCIYLLGTIQGYFLYKVGVLRASHKISDSKPRTCWNDASKFSSISSCQLTQELTGPGRSNGHGRAQLKISWHERRKINGKNKSKQILNLKSEFYCFFSLKPASTVFPPNCRSKCRFGVKKGLWESRSTFTLGNMVIS